MVGLQGASERVVATVDPHRIASWNRRRDGVTRIDLTADEEDFEACDDGNSTNTDGCTNGCVLLFDAEAVF